MSESERPEVVAEEVQSLNDFVDTLIVDPNEIYASKSTPPKKKTTEEESPRVPLVKPTRISRPPVPLQRVRPFQELYDKLIKEISPSIAKEICLLKNQVNDTNILREKLKDQRKKNKEMNAYMCKQSKFIRFQQMGIEKVYRIMRSMCAKMEIEPMFSFEEVFDFDVFIEEETTRKAKEAKAKKKRLESTERVTEGDESDEEEVDRDETHAKFIEWGLEEEVVYEQEDRKNFSPQHPEWFKKEREKLPDFYQVITVEKTEATDKIISWMYNNLRGMFVVKRRGGTGFERLISKECNEGFPNHRPQCPRRRMAKTTRDPVTRNGKVTWVINPAKVVTRIKLPEEVSVSLNNFKKWFYDSKTCEAVIRSNENVDIRILDPMDVFMFGLSDLTVLNASHINVGAGNANLEEAMLFQRAVDRAWKIKREMLDHEEEEA
ncbi:hypothetical protein Hanom_Chr04g00282521 [Helianthus anomalus]